MKQSIRNPLLSQPPEQYHRLSNTSRFRQIMGRAPVAADYCGVHTTDSKSVAAAYAISAWTLRGERADDMPVLIRLRTDGLEPLADVDAMLQGMEIYDAIRSEVAGLLSNGTPEDEIEHAFEDYTLESDLADLVGLDPAAVVFDDIMRNPPNPISLLIKHGGQDAVVKFAESERGGVPDRALSEIVHQRRYLSDFDLNRVVGIDAFTPWWGEIVNEDDEDAIRAIFDAQWYPITFDEAASGYIKPLVRCIYGERFGGEDDYHGTAMGVVRASFPGIKLGNGFPPPAPRSEVGVIARGEDVDEGEDD